MRASPWLQRKFDSSADRKTVKKSLKAMQENIHPDFEASFKVFKKDLLWVLKKHPANDNVAIEQLHALNISLKKSNKNHGTDTFDSIMDNLAA